ncbi:hypothetical protein BC938DRAFT_475183 [Jimgerdemannia flammicorona]|uniref:Uncharacterized protein n=1 Tax=Jimgerdemannia flammicorona TaxID=994334 RepID=A0A433PZ96_9FUNG|nr:hypothetical protein BC938DRAFT_475183 [Jimgerdemannia flammicorona]
MGLGSSSGAIELTFHSEVDERLLGRTFFKVTREVGGDDFSVWGRFYNEGMGRGGGAGVVGGGFGFADVQAYLEDALSKRIMFMDGAMGTMIQRLRLEEPDFRGIVL